MLVNVTRMSVEREVAYSEEDKNPFLVNVIFNTIVSHISISLMNFRFLVEGVGIPCFGLIGLIGEKKIQPN